MSTPARRRRTTSIRTSLLLGAAGLAALASASCTKAPPPLAVGLITDLAGVPDPLAKIQITAKRDGKTITNKTWDIGTGTGQLALPTAWLLEMDDPDGATVRLDVTGTLASGRTLARSANLKSLPGGTHFYRMALAASCLGVSCDDDKTCIEGRCEPLDFDAGRLLNYVVGHENTLQCSTTVAARGTATLAGMSLRPPGACSGSDPCIEGTCYRPATTCGDRKTNDWETDIDCGWGCGLCPDRFDCVDGRDCESHVCGKAHTCDPPTCTDGVQNGDETGPDCGGRKCPARCGGGIACLIGDDCFSGVCNSFHRCAGPSCSDGTLNGLETDVDCGGPTCAPCAVGKACARKVECVTFACENNKCADLFANTNAVYPIGTDKEPRGLATADFNADGKTDIVFANSGAATVSMAVRADTGFWQATYPVKTLTGQMSTAPWSIRVVRLPYDNLLDLVVSNNQGRGLDIFTGTKDFWGDPTFKSYSPIDMGGPTRDTAVGDIDQDGNPDLVSANYFGVAVNRWSVPNSTWLGVSGIGDYSVDPDTASIELGDLDEDGALDIVVASEKPSTLSVLLNMSVPDVLKFKAKPKLLDMGFSPRHIQLVDVNGDKHLDVVAAANTSSEVCVALGQGTGEFNPAQHYDVGGPAQQVVVADVNYDGLPDIVVADGQLGVLFGRKDGSWAPVVHQKLPHDVFSIAVADFNVDGRPDVAVADAVDKKIYFYLNQSH